MEDRKEVIKSDDQLGLEDAWNELYAAVVTRDDDSTIDWGKASARTINRAEAQLSRNLHALQSIAEYLGLDV